ncbi:Uncharacterized protein MCB1EB_1745 [Mycoavidus cysteinexigens]|uniref:Uncharacterized protein n=1 Tax=Mycoavidus cysteinexigens TaxID=1553431 RepID=A0A2Z6EWW3_9BURK|nr:type III secretion protein HrpB4 [Mycoavidus cysteinexigens]BBE09906.1 Uncharacterized protein MCB1EB_1745 [Mycoavidus cysteinexigens]GAM53749.1 hypothetical protein EBME_2212 [bacterium endosymbiont of Mortierella elongata FMR23-6]GLR00346.1 type III secretion protein HrpB4 [Mycoavidus cysteinexigens]
MAAQDSLLATHQEYAALIAAYSRNLAVLPRYIHASWWGGLAKLVVLGYQGEGLKCTRALFALADMKLPRLEDFQGLSGKLGALASPHALQCFRLRALAFRRSELRHSIDRKSRALLRTWLDAAELDQLMALPGSPQTALLERSFEMKPLIALQQAELEWEGLCLFGRDRIWAPTGPFAWLKMHFPREQAPLPWVMATCKQDGGIDTRFDPNGSEAVLAMLPDLNGEELC